ncbi:hypothetical protein F2P56_031139 [Juglans regia]|uniref:Reticulon-like protein n=2 Tax=Juglans regia TaxID=51240 RepID=A0A2I4HRH5_JUGRE|nr:reticulon-like protein B14 [Juglans regia]KAF5450820.1 hypothetical protein F2P56_031139 [Juglans regia]
MAKTSFSSHSEYQTQSWVGVFGHGGTMHDNLGRGKVADILMWKNKKLSAAILIVLTSIWFLFEVVEYQFITFLCHILITAMTLIFVWSKVAGVLIDWRPPNIHDFSLSESTCRFYFAKVNWFLFEFFEISTGKDLKSFFVAIACLWVLSVIGTYFSSLNLLYLVFLCMQILPVLYKKYERQVDYLATKGRQDAKSLYRKFDSKVLNKIPRGPVKQRKFH